MYIYIYIYNIYVYIYIYISGKNKNDDECLLAEGRALEHRQRFCDWDKWSKYAMLEQVIFCFVFTRTNGQNMPCSSRLFVFVLFFFVTGTYGQNMPCSSRLCWPVRLRSVCLPPSRFRLFFFSPEPRSGSCVYISTCRYVVFASSSSCVYAYMYIYTYVCVYVCTYVHDVHINIKYT